MSRLINRRGMLKLTAAGVAGAAVYKGLEWFGALPTLAQLPGRVVDAGKFHEACQTLGNWIYLSPQKLGGGTHAVDMATCKTLAWISYWNYGDTCPISHHLAAYPSDDPYKGFEFVNSTQGGENVLIYGIPTRIKQMGLLERTGEGNHIYRVRYDGQKDICAFFNRARGNEKTKVLMAFRGDWVPKNKTSLERGWIDGGTLRLTRLTEPKETSEYEYDGVQGNKINWEMVPMAELLVERGQIPGASPQTLTGLDAVVHHPGNRYSALILRMPAAALIMDR